MRAWMTNFLSINRAGSRPHHVMLAWVKKVGGGASAVRVWPQPSSAVDWAGQPEQRAWVKYVGAAAPPPSVSGLSSRLRLIGKASLSSGKP